LRVVLRHRATGEASWREKVMAPLGNDRYGARFTPRALGGHAMGAARPLGGPARFAAYAAGQAACVAHVPEHDLGAAAYAIKAAQAAAPPAEREKARRLECAWQRAQLPAEVRDLIIDDQQRRNDICWSVFDN
jgi:hypothetical protein